jgi:flagellar motility protein MotE (MotC chaperone)
MKPADAARIMDDMDIETTIMVLGTMKPRIAAPILAKMSPVRARAVSKIILERSQLPGDQDLTGIRLN